MVYILIYILFVSLFSIYACIFDKISAARGGWRVSERNLLLLCAMGGSVAMYVTMRIFHHKTRHNKFMIGIPVIIIIQLAIIVGFIYLI